jgi:hypothetical protein
MNSTADLMMENRILSVKAFFYGALFMHRKEREALEQLLVLRRQIFSPGDAAIGSVCESLAHATLGYHVDDLHKADALAQEAEQILVLTGKHGKNSFRVAKLIHLRCQIQQRLNNPRAALDLGEEALEVYNNTKLLCHQRSSLMHTLIHLHNEVGSAERAERLTVEVKAVDYALMMSATRRRF